LSFKAINGYRGGSDYVKLILCVIDTLSKIGNSIFNFLFVVLGGGDLKLNRSLPFDQCIEIILKTWNLGLNCLDIDSSLLDNV
jgi:hypothetical protein